MNPDGHHGGFDHGDAREQSSQDQHSEQNTNAGVLQGVGQESLEDDQGSIWTDIGLDAIA